MIQQLQIHNRISIFTETATHGEIDTIKRVGEKIFDHLQVIEYYRYLKEYDESCESIIRYPKPLQVEGEEPELSICFIKTWEREYAKNHTQNWKLEDLKRIKRSKFAELYSSMSVEENSEEKFGRPLFQVFLFVYLLDLDEMHSNYIHIYFLKYLIGNFVLIDATFSAI